MHLPELQIFSQPTKHNLQLKRKKEKITIGNGNMAGFGLSNSLLSERIKGNLSRFICFALSDLELKFIAQLANAYIT
jgi:hypothetical protein